MNTRASRKNTADKAQEVNGKTVAEEKKEEVDTKEDNVAEAAAEEPEAEIDLTEGGAEYVLVDENEEEPSDTEKDGKETTEEAKSKESEESAEKDDEKKKETDKKVSEEKKTSKGRDFVRSSGLNSDPARKQQFKSDRFRHMKDRSVAVWPITRDDLADPKLQEHLDKSCNVFIRFYGNDWAKKVDEGHIELRYKTFSEAKEAMESLVTFKEGLNVKHLSGGDNVELAKMTWSVTGRTVPKLEEGPGKVPVDYRTVYVGTLPTNVSEETLKATFPDAVTILIPKDDNDVSKGYAYLEYDSVEEATEAVKKYKDVKIEEKTLSVTKLLLRDPPDTSGEKLPPGALHEAKRRMIYNKISNTKRRLRLNQETPSPILRRIMNGWYQRLVRDIEVRKENKLPLPEQTPRDPNREYAQQERKMEQKRQYQYRRQQEETLYRQESPRMQSPMKRRRTESGGGKRWRSDDDRSWREDSYRGGRDWDSRGMMEPPAPKHNMQTANAVNLLMGLSSMLGNQGGGNPGMGGMQGGGMGPGMGSGMGPGMGQGMGPGMMGQGMSSPGNYSDNYGSKRDSRWRDGGARDNYGGGGFINKRRNRRGGKNYY